jgi:hypothetical protein
LRWEVFNLFNRPNFGNPSGNFSSSAFGQISSAADPRIMQVGLKFVFSGARRGSRKRCGVSGLRANE